MSDPIAPVGRAIPPRNAARQDGRAPRFGMPVLLRKLRDYRREAEERGQRDAMDRRRVLHRLAEELGAEPALLLERGFDKAYRRVVEGV
jgi:hypothetical protein